MLTAEKLIRIYNMKPHPQEGGFYTETYRSAHKITKDALPEHYIGDKHHCTAIYFMHTPETKSFLHRLPTDEIYHFYLGDPVQLIQLNPDGSAKIVFLGPDIEAGQFVQVVVPAGVWHGSYLVDGGEFALMGTTMAPGFDFDDFELGESASLIEEFPAHKDTIEMLTP